MMTDTPATAQPTPDARRPTRQLIAPDVPTFDSSALDAATRKALAELLLTMADDEFVIGFWDSEWTGIAPLLEEDVAFSSIAQDEIGHARVWYEMLAQLSGSSADAIAFGRPPEEYHHAALVDHARGDWALAIARKWLYETADAVRLEALAASSFVPLAEVVAKVRREERYHLLHLDAWLRRLAAADGEPRVRLAAALEKLAPDASSVFAPLAGESALVDAGILAAPMSALAERWSAQVRRVRVDELGFAAAPSDWPTADGRDHSSPSESFRWLWGEFTSVARLEEGVEW
jgi:ring-1,2-phenylacetyl-CoA epoxidase subunit PaaC